MTTLAAHLNLLVALQEEAASYAEQFGLDADSVHNGEWDAFRHAYASAELSRIFNEDIAQTLGELHEIEDDLVNDQPAVEKNMDLFNNAVGRGLCSDAVSSDEVAQRVFNALRDGQLITSLSDNRPSFTLCAAA